MEEQEKLKENKSSSNITKDDKDRLDSYLDAGSAYTDKNHK